MEQKVMRFIQEKQLLQKHKKIIIGLSGGPDSVALLHFLKGLRERWHLEVIAITINHQLRGEAACEDVNYTKQICSEWDVPLIVREVNVQQYARKHKLGIQVAARKARYAVFSDIMEEERADYLALGHHGDDQIETITMSFIRTTNLSGIKGIPIRRQFGRGEIIRPFLTVSKKDIEIYCRNNEITPQVDQSNEDLTYTRNYIRKLVVPKLKRQNERLHTTIQQLSETIQEDETYLLNQAEEALTRVVVEAKKHESVILHIDKMASYPPSIQRRIFRFIVHDLYKTLPSQLTYVHENLFLSLLHIDGKNRRIQFPQRLIVEKVYDHIECYFSYHVKKPQSFHHIVWDLPKTITLPKGDEIQISQASTYEGKEDEQTYICPVAQVDFPLHIRTRRAGDRIKYQGLKGSKKIKDIFIDEKIPPRKREEYLIITDDRNEILWLVGLRKGILSRDIDEGPYIIIRHIKENQK